MPKDKLPMVAKLQEAYGDFGERLLKNKVKVVFASDYVGSFPDAEPEYKLIPTIHLVMKGGQIYRNEIDGKLSEAAISFPGMKYEGIIRDYIH